MKIKTPHARSADIGLLRSRQKWIEMQVYQAHSSATGRNQAREATNRVRDRGFSRQFDAAMKKTQNLQPRAGQHQVSLGVISKAQPTVSHLLAADARYGSDCWQIIHSQNNQAKPYTRIPGGTEIFLNPKTREITWAGDLIERNHGPQPVDSFRSGYSPRGLSQNPASALPDNEQQVIQEAIDLAAYRHNLPRELIAGVIRAESGFNANAVSTAGAQGLMQLMPGTARELGVENPFDIRENIDAGTRYLKKMLRLFNDNLEKALSAYNAGPATVLRYNGEVPYNETRQYVARVMSFLG